MSYSVLHFGSRMGAIMITKRCLCTDTIVSLLRLTVLLTVLTSCRVESVSTVALGATPAPSPGALQSTHAPDAGDTRIRTRDDMSMVYVPAGQFEMGMSDAQVDEVVRICRQTDDGCRREWFKSTQPAHTVTLDAFWIDQTEVTNAMFAAFLNEQGNQVEDGVSWLEPGAGHRGIVYGHIREHDGVFQPETAYKDHPVIEVSWYGAEAYCAWVGGRLPSEAEWEYAARGPQSNLYPWGNAFEGGRANHCDVHCPYDWKDRDIDDGSAQWAPVRNYPDGVSWCGVLDMAGNVWEWVADWWSDDYDAHSPAHNPRGPDWGTLRIARGGSWFDPRWQLSSPCRKALTPSSYRIHWVGFRCVIPAEPKQ